MISEEYQIAYAEVLEILQKIPYIDYLKIPKEKIKLFNEYAKNKHNFKYNPALTLDEQHVSEKAKYIIAILYRDYWASPEEKEQIILKQKMYLYKIEEEKRKKYSSTSLFNDKRQPTSSSPDTTKNNLSIIPNNPLVSFFQKIKKLLSFK